MPRRLAPGCSNSTRLHALLTMSTRPARAMLRWLLPWWQQSGLLQETLVLRPLALLGLHAWYGRNLLLLQLRPLALLELHG